MAAGLGRRGHACFLAFADLGRDPADYCSAFQKCYPCTDTGARATDHASLPLARIIEETGAEVLLFHNISQLPDLATLCPAVRAVRMVHDISLVCPTGHGYYRHGKRSCPHRMGWRCVLDFAYVAPHRKGFLPVQYVSLQEKKKEIEKNRCLDAIIAPSAYLKSRLVQNGFAAEKVFVVAPVISPPKPSPTPVPDGPEILYVGSLLRGKGLDLLFKSLVRVGSGYHLKIVGTGKSENSLRRLAGRLGIADKISFCGWVVPDELDGYYRNSRLVVVPSRAPESFCLVGPEAMRHGRPVVAFDVGGISEWLEHKRTGLMVPEQDLGAFARAIEELLCGATAERMGATAAERYASRFGADRLDEVESILRGDVTGDREGE